MAKASKRNNIPGPVRTSLVIELLSRLATRNIENPLDRATTMLQVQSNLKTLGSAPEGHMAFALASIDKQTRAGEALTFENGLLLGACMVMCSRTERGRGLLAQVIADIDAHQRASDAAQSPASGAV